VRKLRRKHDWNETVSTKKKSRQRVTWRLPLVAEGMGLEPTTPCGALHFQSVDSSGAASGAMTIDEKGSVDILENCKQPGDARVTAQVSSNAPNCPDIDDPELSWWMDVWRRASPSQRDKLRAIVPMLID
jgi:hypothetical protein